MYSDFYEIPLPALHFEKVEETVTKVNDTEENNAFQIDHVRRTQETSEMQMTLGKEKQTHSQEMTRKGTQTLPEQRGQKKKNINKRFKKNGKPDHYITDDASQKRIFL